MHVAPSSLQSSKEAHQPCFPGCLSDYFELGSQLLVRFGLYSRWLGLVTLNPKHLLQFSFSKKFHWQLQALAQLKLKGNFDFTFVFAG